LKPKPFIFALFFGLFLQTISFAQNDTILVRAEIEDGDTLASLILPESVVANLFGNPGPVEAQRIARLIKNVRKVYPYARLAGLKYQEYSKQLEAAKSRRERNAILDVVEDEIKNRYGDELKRLTFSQGKILIKLIDRQTRNTSYSLVKDMKGGFSAFFYQSFAKMWGYNLKTKYDPTGEDKEIEMIVNLIESGSTP
jgi:hypothetical protein